MALATIEADADQIGDRPQQAPLPAVEAATHRWHGCRDLLAITRPRPAAGWSSPAFPAREAAALYLALHGGHHHRLRRRLPHHVLAFHATQAGRIGEGPAAEARTAFMPRRLPDQGRRHPALPRC